MPAGAERVAAVIDLGSNSWRFVAYRYKPQGAWRRIAELQEPVRIAKGLAATGALAAERLAHGLEALQMFERYGRPLGIEPQETSVVATSALRDARNGDKALARARALTGLEIRGLTAKEEAHYGYVAAVNSSTLSDGLALDLGGGSLQVVAVRDREPHGYASWPLGAVRVTEAMLPGDWAASRKQLKRARTALREALAGEHVLAGGGRIVGMGGAVRNLASAATRARRGAPASVQGGTLAIGELRDLIATLARRAPRRPGPRRASRRPGPTSSSALRWCSRPCSRWRGRIGSRSPGPACARGCSSRTGSWPAPRRWSPTSARPRCVTSSPSTPPTRSGPYVWPSSSCSSTIRARDAGAMKTADDERQLLWAAAMVHDIGMAVGYEGHPNHARYVLLNCELYGFTPRDVALVAQIVRYHRKGMPALDEHRRLAGTPGRPPAGGAAARCCCDSQRS